MELQSYELFVDFKWSNTYFEDCVPLLCSTIFQSIQKVGTLCGQSQGNDCNSADVFYLHPVTFVLCNDLWLFLYAVY